MRQRSQRCAPSAVIAGTVAQVGANVTGLEIGQRLAIPATVAGPGTGTNGGFAEQVKAFDYQVIPVPDDVHWEQAAPATDAGMTSYHALKERSVKKRTKLGIIGAGGLGSLAAQFAVAIGADVYVADASESARQRALELGTKQATRTHEYLVHEYDPQTTDLYRLKRRHQRRPCRSTRHD